MEEQLGFVADINSKPMEDGLNRIEERVESTARAVEKSGMSVDEYAKHMQGVLASFDRLTQAVDKNTAAQNKVAEAGKKAADAEKQGADKATEAIKKTDETTKSLGDSLRKTGDEGASGFDKLTKAAAGYFTLAAAKEFAGKIFEVRSEIEKLQTSFHILVGEKDKADELFNSIKEFATKTPMQMKDLASAAQTMMGFGLPVEQIMDNLKALGDVSMGDTQRFQSLALAFSQASAAGKLMGQDLMQMINAGFNPLDQMAKTTGKSIGELKDEMSKGAISADMLRQALIDATSEGGKFHGMLEEQSKTLAGAYSNLQGAITDAFNEIGEQTDGLMAGSIQAATIVVQNYEKIGKVLLLLIATYGEYKVAVMANMALEQAQAFNRLAHIKGITAMQLATEILTAKTKALNAVLMKNPYVLLATAVMSAVTALVLFKNKTDDAAKKAKELQDELKNQDGELGENRAALQRLQDEWKNLASDKEKKKWISENKDEFKKLGIEIDTVGEAENAFVNNSGSIIKAMELRAKAAAYAALATRKYQEALENRESAKNLKDNPGFSDKALAFLKHMNVNKGLQIEANLRNYNASAKENQAKEYIQNEKDLNKQADELLKAAKIKTKTSSTTDKKKGKKGSKTDHTAEQEATARKKLFELEQKELEQQAKDKRELERALTDEEIAWISDDAERERREREEEYNREVEQIKEQANDWKKQNYEAAKAKWEATNKDKTKTFADTPEGAAGWQGQSLNESQVAIMDAQLRTVEAKRERYLNERRQAEQDAMTEYLKEFGTAEERRLAIAQEYDRKIADARTEGERLQLVGQKQQALQTHDQEQSQKAMDLESLFNNLGEMSLQKLQQAKEQLRGMLSAKNLGMDDYKTIAEQIDKVQDAIVAKKKQEKGLLAQLLPNETTLQRLRREQAEALERQRDAATAVALAEQRVKDRQENIQNILSQNGVSWSGAITTSNAQGIIDAAKAKGISSAELERLKKALDGLQESSGKLKNAKDNERQASEEVTKKTEEEEEAKKNLRQRVEEFAQSLQTLNANIQSLPELMDVLGLGDTAAGQAVSGVASAANNIMGGMADFASGNYVGAAVKAVGAVQGITDALGIGADNNAKMQKKIDALNSHTEILTKAMDRLRESFEASTADEAGKIMEDMRDVLRNAEQNDSQALIYEGNKHGRWRSSMHDSVEDNSGWIQAMKEVSAILNKTVTSSKQFLSLTGEEMQKIFDWDNGELWYRILKQYQHEAKNGRSENIDEMLNEYREKYGDAFKDLDEDLQEFYMNMTKEDVFNDFKNNMYELANGSEDVFEDMEQNWQKMINQMVVDNAIFNKDWQDKLEAWYKDFAKLNEDLAEGRINEEWYKSQVEALMSEYTNMTEEAKQEIETFKEMGIIKPIEEGTEEAKTAFDGLRDTFKNDLLDMESDAEKFKKNLQRTLYEDLIEKNVFDVPFTINGQTFDDFEAYSKDWNERYAAAVAEGDTAALDALINELVEAREITATAAESYREALKKLDEQFDTTFKDMGGSWVSVLMGMDSDADAWGKEIGRTMAQKIIEQMVMTSAIQPLLDNLQDEFNRAMGESSTWQEVLADEGLNAALAEIKAAYPELQETVTAIMDKLSLKIEEQAKQGFSDLRGQITSVLLDSEGDWDKDMATFGKNMAETMMKQMLDAMIDSKYKDKMDAISAEWAEALESADPARIDAVKQQVMDLYKEIGDDSEIKQLTADIKALAEVVDDTTTPFDNLRSSYQSYLMDMTKDTKDFTEDLNKMLADAFVDEFVMDKAMDDLIDKYKGQFKAIRDDATLSKEERAKQMKALGGLIAEEAEGLKAETKEVLSWFGLGDNVEDQGAAMNMAEAATYDQFELYLGIATAQQINGERQLDVQTQILQTLQSMSGITSPNGETVKEISSRMRTANEYLLSIRDSNKAILDTMTRKLDVINSNLTRIL